MKNDKIIQKLDEIKSTLEQNDKAVRAMKALKLINKHINIHLMKGDNDRYYIQASIIPIGLISKEIDIKEFDELYSLLQNLY